MARSDRLIAVAFHEPVVGGAARSMLRVMALLEEKGFRFSCWTPGGGALRDQLEEAGYRVAGIPRLLRFSRRSLREPPGVARRLTSTPGYLSAFRRWLRNEDPDLLHANSLLALPEALTARGAFPIVLHVHETLVPGLRGGAAALAARLTGAIVIGNSRSTVAALRLHRVSAHLVDNGVPLPETPGLPSDTAPVVGMLGTVCRVKGSDLFVDAVRILRPKFPTAEFRMLGPSVEGAEQAWADRLLREARRLGVRTGETPDAFTELAGWSVLAAPSRTESFGLAATEAMAMGVPVVAARTGALPDVVGAGGILVPANDATELATAVSRILSEPSLGRSLGQAGRARVEQRFTLAQQAAALEGVYRSAMGGGG